jgi:hypothetical protein
MIRKQKEYDKKIQIINIMVEIIRINKQVVKMYPHDIRYMYLLSRLNSLTDRKTRMENQCA